LPSHRSKVPMRTSTPIIFRSVRLSEYDCTL
jgi:hypothetical protein